MPPISNPLACALAAAVLASASGVPAAHAQTSASANAPVLTLADALDLAGSASPNIDAADAGVRAAGAARRVAALRPNPLLNADIENVGGSRAYNEIEAPKQTVSVGVPVELGGKRSARIAVADAQGNRAQIERVVAGADLRVAVTQAYVEALAADRRLATARDQAAIAAEAVRAAHVRVVAGRASPLEEQRAEVLRISADAAVDRAARLADLARANLGRRIGRPATGALDEAWFDRVDSYGPSQLDAGSSLAVASARADEKAADAQLRLARSQRLPDVTVSAGLRRLPINNDVAAVFGVSVPLPFFNSGTSSIAQAGAERDRATALRRAAELENEQAIGQAQADVANAAAAARTAAGPSLAAAQEAARIARIGYREGKFGQLDLLEAERTLADTRSAAIDALAAFHNAQAQLDRLTASAKD
ncbi:MAG: transporter [Proteobacteria bacterium SG_bin5]|uniref:TolC family protein n=1 Tax=unclassified Sphingomonas TaxID=196159 RepID=UPI000A0DCB02|nr:TolC family protein [Sphingomonas sp. SFZ2018-12]MBX9813154.1 TolC family protein [Sphingomonas sp.]MCH4894049.1 TolC family protein [Sphingomonas sp. SFZ2018-12]OQW43632.1 MAG: transporter [Proteobacteria bacterium SG_bin5]